MTDIHRVPPALRRAIRDSEESIRTLAVRHGLNPKTIAKWRHRTDPTDRQPGPRRSAALTLREEASILAFRRYLALSLDDSMALLAPRFPTLSRSALHRLFKRHGLCRPPRHAGLPDAARRAGCFQIDIVPVSIAGREHYIFFAVEQTSGLIFGLLKNDATQATACDFLAALADGSPGRVRLVLTGDRFQFTTPGNSVSGAADVREALEKGMLAYAHPFEYACVTRGIDHHLVPDHFPWSQAQASVAARITMSVTALLPADEATTRDALHRELARHNSCPLPSLGGLSPGTSLAQAHSAMEIRDVENWQSRRRDSTRAAILEAARARLAMVGPEGLNLSEVARAAGVSRGTAYQHFRTRDGLVAATGQWMAERLHRAMFGQTGGGGRGGAPEGGMAGMAGRLAAFAMDNPELCRAWLLQLLAAPEPTRDPFWRDYSEAMTRASAGGGRGNAGVVMDAAVASVAMLGGALLWPALGRTGPCTTGHGVEDKDAAARRFARAWLRPV